MFQLKPNYERKLRSVQDSLAMMSVRKVALYDFFPWGYSTDYIGRFFVELKNGNSLLADNATIAEVETREVKFYANYADSGSNDYVYTFEIV